MSVPHDFEEVAVERDETQLLEMVDHVAVAALAVDFEFVVAQAAALGAPLKDAQLARRERDLVMRDGERRRRHGTLVYRRERAV